MTMSGFMTRGVRRGVFAGTVLGGIAAATIAAPAAGAETCSAVGTTATVGSVSTATSQFLATHPGSDQVLTAALSQGPEEARGSVRSYFTAHPDEYFALKGITAPLVDLQNQCGTAGLPPAWVEAFNEFQNG